MHINHLNLFIEGPAVDSYSISLVKNKNMFTLKTFWILFFSALKAMSTQKNNPDFMHEMVHWGGDCILCTCKLCDHVTTVCAVCYIHVYIEMFIANTEYCYSFFYNWQYTVSIMILCVYVSVYVWRSIQSFVVMWVVFTFWTLLQYFFYFFLSFY